ncbi:MAG: lipid-A-disaccharide synthase [Muribaculaceae bacterium]|nr:lipid-A-disaccharide synthase [Muribaculaceae bacterium]
MHYFISAGEASGDIHASQLIRELRVADPDARFTFLGGDLMSAAADTKPLIHYSDMAFMGFCEVIRHLGKVLGNLRLARQSVVSEHPDALILVDYPSFNLKLAKEAVKQGIPVFYYISPKVWAWKEGRVKKIKRYVKRMLSILPFEVEYYRNRHGYEIEYVGNPTVKEVDEKLASLSSDEAFRRRHNLPEGKPLLALVPGSRMGEIRNNLPVMTEVARRHPDMIPVVAGAPAIDNETYRRYCDFAIVDNDTFELMAHARGALVTSGTATLEAALIGVPQVVCYRANGSRISYNIFKHILKIPFVSLPNLIADREVVAEQLVHLCTPELVGAELVKVLPGGERHDDQQTGYREIRDRLTTADSAKNAARIIVETMHNP